METYERIRELRKTYLHLSQTEFGERLGVSRSVIKNIELNALARPDQKLSLMKLICSEFNVNEEWLMNGTGEMYANDEVKYSTLIDQIMSGENELAIKIFKTFTAFDEEDWEALRKMIAKYNSVAAAEHTAPAVYDNIPDTPQELERQFQTIEVESKSN